MNCLVDTHVLLWWFQDPTRIAKDIREIIKDERNGMYYSPVSIWEVSVKYGLGKLELGAINPEAFFAEVERSFFRCLPLENMTIASSYRLPSRHGDPFDRLLIWQAIKNDLVLLSLDGSFSAYSADGQLTYLQNAHR
jgi:PIN domain nuclease of toxin-antitoxin system